MFLTVCESRSEVEEEDDETDGEEENTKLPTKNRSFLN